MISKFFSTLSRVTDDNLDDLKPPMVYAVLEGLFAAIPFAVLACVLPDILAGRLTRQGFCYWYLVLLLTFAMRAVVALKSYHGGMVAGYRIGAAIRLHLGEHLRRLSMGFFSRHNTGELVNRLFQNVSLAEMMIGHFLTQSITNAGTSLFLLAGLLLIIPDLALILPVPLLIGLPLLWILFKLVGREGKKKLGIVDRANAYILEYLHGIVVFKAFNVTGMGFKRLQSALRQLQRFCIGFELKGFGIVLTYAAILELGFVVLMFTGVAFVLNGKLGKMEMFAFLVVALRVFRPLHRFAENASLTRHAFGGIRAIDKIFDQAPIDGSDETPLSDFTIRFDNVGFGYGAAQVIKQVNFTARERSMTALVGASGSGKSTLVRLIARFWDTNRGRITIGGRDIRTMAPDVLLGHISMVFQDVYLFQDTILNNIRIGNGKAGRQAVINAAKKARCHDFIMALPNGYDTVVSEGGATLSGGEKQRISIARAMLKDAPIVLLDEATASLDPENDSLVQLAIDNLVKSKTLIVIAHRLQTVTGADRIMVLDQGRVIQEGSHEQLLAREGRYRHMWNEQQEITGFQQDR